MAEEMAETISKMAENAKSNTGNGRRNLTVR